MKENREGEENKSEIFFLHMYEEKNPATTTRTTIPLPSASFFIFHFTHTPIS